MIAALTALAEIAGPTALAAFAVFLRVGAAMTLLPAFGEQSIPVRVKLMISFGFTAIVAPSVVGDLPALSPQDLAGRLLLTETIIGLSLGAVLRLFILVLQLAGTMAAQSVSISQIMGGAGLDPQPAIGHIMVVAGLAIAVILGLHVKTAQFLIYSYELLPPGQLPLPGDLLSWGVARVSRAFALGFGLAMPFVITSLLYNLTLGVINRAMPQLMVAFVGAPAITMGGLLLLALSLPLMLQVWIGAMDAFLANPGA